MMMTTRVREITRLAADLAALCAIGAAGLTASCFSERVAGAGRTTYPAVCQAAAPPAGYVVIRNFSFQPAQLTVTRGSTVTWVNCETDGTTQHTSTSDGGVWDSGLLAVPEGYSRQFSQAGSFPYHCTPHPVMQATIIVQ
jgi:plastocyanin